MCSPSISTPAGPAYIGEGAGEGFSVNVAWNPGVHAALGRQCGYYGDAEYAAAWSRLLLPLARSFEPDLIIVSAGFDSAAGDEVGYKVTPAGYAHLTQQLLRVESAQGRVVAVLEGGYNIPAISHGMEACVAALCGALDPDAQRRAVGAFGPPSEFALEDMAATAAALQGRWPCLRGGGEGGAEGGGGAGA